MSSHNKYCCVYGCLNSTRNSKVSFFTLPKNYERRSEWLNLINRSDLLNKADLRHKSYLVCSIHFDDSMISVKRIQKLTNKAIPTKFIPDPTQLLPSTAEYKNQSNVIDKSDDSTDDNVPSTSEAYTQTENQQEDKETQTSVDLTVDTPRKRKLRSIFQETEKKKRRLEYELST